tara:strand:+ start:760 stop:1128 length:369 start_codon:yes stop_codon:yes gene_type:complete
MKTSRILVVDDDADLRRLVEVTLSFEKSYQVSQASSCKEAVAALEREAPDLVILDLNLGEAEDDGFSVCSRARELVPPPKVIMVTGSVSAQDQDRCLQLGAVAYLTKPFRPLQLLELVKECL